MSLLIAGIDVETSNACTQTGAVLQLGMCVPSGDGLEVFTRTVRHVGPWTGGSWSQAAEDVHGLSQAQVAAGDPAERVDVEGSEWLVERGGVPGRPQVTAVGFNTGSFDLPFLDRGLPGVRSMLSHRVVDLNAVLLTMDGMPFHGRELSWLEWKDVAKEHGHARLAELGIGGGEHDAGYDAALAVSIWFWLRQNLLTN